MAERSHSAGNLPMVGPHQSCTDLFFAFPREHAAILRCQCMLRERPGCRPLSHPAMSTKTTWTQPNAPHAIEQGHPGWDGEHHTPAHTVLLPMADSIPTRRRPNVLGQLASLLRVCNAAPQTSRVVDGRRRQAHWACLVCISTARGSRSKSTSLGFGPMRCPGSWQAKDCSIPWSSPE